MKIIENNVTFNKTNTKKCTNHQKTLITLILFLLTILLNKKEIQIAALLLVFTKNKYRN